MKKLKDILFLFGIGLGIIYSALAILFMAYYTIKGEINLKKECIKEKGYVVGIFWGCNELKSNFETIITNSSRFIVYMHKGVIWPSILFDNKDGKNYEQSVISDEGIEWLGHEWNRDKTIISEIGLAQVNTFGFKLDEKYKDKLVLNDVEDYYEDMFYILTYQIKDSHIEVIRNLIKKNIKYAPKDIRDLGKINHYSRNAKDIDYSYNKYADCIVLSEFENLPPRENHWLDICLWDKYLRVYYKYIY